MATKINKKAFTILTKDEQASLALQQVHGKSTWQAGEIMKKSHYKYLEINQRAKKFFAVFQEHFNIFGQLIPDGLKLDEDFVKYLHATIELRLPVKVAASRIDKPNWAVKKHRDEILATEIIKLGKDKRASAVALYTVIMEFDRYNNFRILPSSVQEPSAFKRRNKTRFKKHLTTSLSLTPYVKDRIIQLFGRKKATDVGYIVLADNETNKTEVVMVSAANTVVETLSSISIYIFKEKTTAEEYKELVDSYLILENKGPKDGLKFWPKYRTIVQEALNFTNLHNIVPSRINLMNALKFMDEKYANERANKRLGNNLKKEGLK